MAYVVPIPQLARTEAEPLLATVGNTPLLRLDKIAREFPGVEIFAKAEYFNPGGSVKDRAALNMVLDGERSGRNVHAATLLAREMAARGESATIVTVLCDSAEKYLSEQFWDE